LNRLNNKQIGLLSSKGNAFAGKGKKVRGRGKERGTAIVIFRQSTIDNGQSTIIRGGQVWWFFDNRQSTMDNGQSTMDNRQSTIDNGQWTMDNREWAIEKVPLRFLCALAWNQF